MNPDSFFCHLSSKGLAKIIEEARELVCYSAPGIVKEPAEALVVLSKRIGAEKLTVCIDCDERVLRMGYGDLEAVKMLREAGIAVNHFPKLRSALCIVDKEGYSFTPTALYLEAELGIESCNAIRLSPGQVSEALKKFHGFMESKTAMVSGRVSPQEKILIAESEQKEVCCASEELSSEATISLKTVDEKQLSEIERSFQMAPPVQFDLARQVRVFQSFFQYVEIRLKGAAIQRRRLEIPKELLRLGGGKELEGRLRTTFELVEKDSPLSSKKLEKKLNDIRDDFTFALKNEKGRVLLTNRKQLFENAINDFKTELESHQEEVKNLLQKKLDESLEQIVNYYLPIVMNNPPTKLKAKAINDRDEKTSATQWINSVMKRTFPKSEDITSKMILEYWYKDVTYETLNDNDFLDQIKGELLDSDWKKAYSEFMAAGEQSSEPTKTV